MVNEMILLFSDSHNDRFSFETLYQRFKRYKFKAAIHLGDVTDFNNLSILREISEEFYLVKGNNDRFDMENVAILKKLNIDFSFPPYEIFIEPFGFITIMHEPYFLKDYILKDHTRYIFYGHTHRKELKEENSKIIVNPGSISKFLSRERTYALISKDEVLFEKI